MQYLLDTNVISESARPQSPFRDALLRHSRNIPGKDLFVSTLTVVESKVGLELLKLSRKIPAEFKSEIIENVETILSGLEKVPFGEEAAMYTVEVQAAAASSGRKLGVIDACLAGQAIQMGAVLVSHDKKAFEGLVVPGLVWVDWFE